MIITLTANELKQIAYVGGGFSIDASIYTASELQNIAFVSKPNSILILENCDKFTFTELKRIAYASKDKGSIIFKGL